MIAHDRGEAIDGTEHTPTARELPRGVVLHSDTILSLAKEDKRFTTHHASFDADLEMKDDTDEDDESAPEAFAVIGAAAVGDGLTYVVVDVRGSTTKAASEASEQVQEAVGVAEDAAPPTAAADNNSGDSGIPVEGRTTFDDPGDPDGDNLEGLDEGDDEPEGEIEDVPAVVTHEVQSEINKKLLAGDRAKRALDDVALLALHMETEHTLTPEQLEAVLKKEVADGQQARDRLVETHISLATWGAETFNIRLSFNDACGAAYYGLLKAAQRFDPSQGKSFSAYAAPWIKREIFNETYDQGYPLRLTREVGEKLFKMHSAHNRLSIELGHTPTSEELMTDMDIEAPALARLKAVEFRLGRFVDIDQLAWMMGDDSASDGGSLSLPPPSWFSEVNPVETQVIQREFNTQLRALLAKIIPTLPPGQQKTLTLLTGVEDPENRKMPDDFSPAESIKEMAELRGDSINTAFAQAQRLYASLLHNPRFREFFDLPPEEE